MDFLPEGVAFNKDITYLAKTNFRNKEQVFGIRRKDRRQHMYILGKSGSGKSALLGNMIVQNIWNGEGVCVVDPHGELVESILATIPAHRVKDVVYFNPADVDFHMGFNVLEVNDPQYKHLVASGLMGIFTKIWANVWSSRMEYIMNNAILALVETPGSTLLGIPRLLVDKDYRQMVINNVKDPVIKSFWIHEFESWREQFRNEAIAPIQNKVGQFLSTAVVRNVVGQSKSTIDLFNIMNTGKIFLVNVSKGRIGEDNSALLGGMLITKIQLAAMERVRIPEDERRDFYLYVDEFQNFVTESFASILSEARKYRLNLTLAHQYIGQLSTKDSDSVRDAVFGNVGTMIIFRVGAADGEFLEKEFEPEFEIQDLVNLPNYSAYMKLMVDGITSRPFSALTLPPFKTPASSTVTEEIIESSRKLYARPRDEVEREINQWSGMGGESSGVEGKFKADCSSCQKETTVPFAPEPGRPVYCKDCITKIKNGEMQPIKGTKGKDLRPQSYAPLAGLGIEFTDTRTAPSPRQGQAPLRSAAATSPRPNAFQKPPLRTDSPRSATGVASPAFTPRPASAFTPRPQAASPVRSPQSSPVVASVSPRPDQQAPAPMVRKGPDHEGLQSILKQALSTAAPLEQKKSALAPAETPKPVAPAPQKTISLASLKKPETNSESTAAPHHTGAGVPKVASTEHLSALQEAIQKAKEIAKAAHVAQSKPAIAAQPEVTLGPTIAQTPVALVVEQPAAQPIAQQEIEKKIETTTTVVQNTFTTTEKTISAQGIPELVEQPLQKPLQQPTEQPMQRPSEQSVAQVEPQPVTQPAEVPVPPPAKKEQSAAVSNAESSKVVREIPENILKSILAD